MKIGIVKVDAFKKMAWAVKKRIEGCKHTQALGHLARACGMKNYHEVLAICANGLPTDELMQGSRDELIEAWTVRIARQFGVAIDTILTVEEIDFWFTKVFVDRDRLVADAEVDDVVIKEIHDPRLEAANWRDAEFRQWVQGVVDLEAPALRQRADEYLNGEGDDSNEVSSRAPALLEE